MAPAAAVRHARSRRDGAKEKGDAGLVVIGVHRPELPQERDIANVRAAVKRLGITYPVMIDGEYSCWNALDNRYWPAFYLIEVSLFTSATPDQNPQTAAQPARAR